MISGIDPKVDYAFKRLFGTEQNRPLLISLLNAVLDEPGGRRVVEVELLNPFNPREFEADKLSIVDVRAKDQAGRNFIVEMQMIAWPDLPQRHLHYIATTYRQQIGAGDGYDKLRPVVLVAILCEPLRNDRPEYHMRFRMEDSRYGVVFSEDFVIHTIELSKFHETPDDLETQLDVWSYFLKDGERLDPDALPPKLATPEIRHALQEMDVIAKNDEERTLYEDRLRYERDQKARTEHLRRAALEKFQEGRLEGRQEGQESGFAEATSRHIQFLQRMLGLPVSPPADLASLSRSQLESLSAQLEERFAANRSSHESP